MNLTPGQVIHDLRIIEPVAEGPHTILLSGEQMCLHRKVALKVLRPELAAHDTIRQKFRNNGRQMAMLVHPGIVPVYDIVETEETTILVCKLVEGIPVWGLGGKIASLDSLLQSASDILLPLKAAHENGLPHGNLHPGNVLFQKDGSLCLSDFGSDFTGRATGRTETAQAFFPPEQMQLSPQESDIYMVGRILTFLATGNAMATADLMPQLKWLVTTLSGQNPEIHSQTAADALPLLKQCKQVNPSTEKPVLPPADRRRYRRFPTTMRVVVAEQRTNASTAKTLMGKISDISENGAFVPTPAPLSEGSFVRLQFEVDPQKVRLDVVGIVRWIEPGSGMGIQFLQVATADGNALRGLVAQRQLDEIQKLISSSSLHRQIIRFIRLRWGVPLSQTQLLGHLGTSRVLLDRAIHELNEVGLLKSDGDMVTGIYPSDEEVATLVSQI